VLFMCVLNLGLFIDLAVARSGSHGISHGE